jgi:hypothetical protein
VCAVRHTFSPVSINSSADLEESHALSAATFTPRKSENSIAGHNESSLTPSSSPWSQTRGTLTY